MVTREAQERNNRELDNNWHITTDDWNGNTEAVINALHTVRRVYNDIFGEQSVNTTIPVTFLNWGTDHGNPEIAPDNWDNPGIFFISLSIRNFTPEQVTYQAAHEVCHLMLYCHNPPDNRKILPNEFMWFEEVICEVASWYVLNKVGQRCPDLQGFFNNYLNDITSIIQRENTQTLYAEKGNILRGNPYDRSLNNIFALACYKNHDDTYFNIFFNAMAKIHQLKNITFESSFTDFLNEWSQHLSDEEKTVAANIYDIFGILRPDVKTLKLS